MTGTILVVEDQDSARESLAELLRSEGYEVHEAADGNTAKDFINQLDLDIILTALMMPGADGIADAFRDRQLLIADGHHRYETALTFHDEDAFAALGGSPEHELAAALASLRAVLTGPRIQVRCLECGPVAPARLTTQDKGFLATLAQWF